MKTLPENTSEFARVFQSHLDDFIVIGGTPTLLYIEQRAGNIPRVTKDLDIVILDVSELRDDNIFLNLFSKYIKDNKYECKTLSSGKAQSYRFTDPKSALAPRIIEISTQRQNGIQLDQRAQRLENFEMSAIVCEPYFIKMLTLHREFIIIEDATGLRLPVAKASLLILMKAYATENLRKSESTDDRTKAKKHLNDILRLTRILTNADKITVPKEVRHHLDQVLKEAEKHFSRKRMDSCGWKNRGIAEVVGLLNKFIITQADGAD